MKRLIIGAILVGSACLASAQSDRVDIAEESTVRRLGKPSDHWVFVTDSSASALTANRIWVIDGDSQKVLGLLSAGYMANFAVAPDAARFYVSETFWSRGARGTRIDVITHYEPATLSPVGETVLPKGRFLTGTKVYALRPTWDGMYLLSANMRPATSVSVVHAASQRYVAELPTPGCVLAYPHGTRRFSSLCADGSFLTVSFDAGGKADRIRGKPFFDPIEDPVFEHPAVSRPGRIAYFLSYAGRIYPVNLSNNQPAPEAPWMLVSPSERKQGWRPGGAQPIEYHHRSGRLFVLMHQGSDWTHKDPASEVWIFDAASRRRLARIGLKEPAIAVAVTRDAEALMFTINGKDRLSIYDAKNNPQYLGSLDEIGTWTTALELIGN